MHTGAQALYYHNLIIADREGLIDRDTAIQSAFSTEENMKELAANGYVLDLGDVVAVTHWYIHNPSKPSQRINTIYPDARNRLRVKAGIYVIND